MTSYPNRTASDMQKAKWTVTASINLANVTEGKKYRIVDMDEECMWFDVIDDNGDEYTMGHWEVHDLARASQGDFKLDNHVDQAAYSALAGECAGGDA